MNTETQIIVAEPPKFPTFALAPTAIAARDAALASAALIGKVTDRDSKIVAVRVQQELKAVINGIEKTRVELKEPALVYGRELDKFAAREKLEAEKEFGRVSNAVKEFDDAERRRVAEEERLQRLELERIEREKQAELKRIADEVAAKEAEAARQLEESRKALAAATKLAEEAKNKKQREAAEAARQEALRRELQIKTELERAAVAATTQVATIEEKAGDAAYIAARPIEISKVAGQVSRPTWEITKINEWALAKGRPDLVRKIEFDMVAVKSELNRGVKLPGVEAREVYKADVRLRPGKDLIEV